jgi:uncharacterized protein (DUF58 family)
VPWPTPTPRCAALLALVAVTALFLPLGLTVAGAIVLIAAAAADAWSVRRPAAIERSLPTVLSLRQPIAVALAVSAPDDRRLLIRQPASAALSVTPGAGGRPRSDLAGGPALELRLAGGQAQASVALTGLRRGTHPLPGVASASIGPLGLSRVHHPAGAELQLRVYPDLVSARALVTRLRRDLAGHAGRAARGALGLGTDFESVREYTPDDDIRQLNWRASARMGRPMSNQYRLERDRDVVCLIDCGRLMAAPAGSSTLLDVALDAVAVLALAADELGDRCGAIAFDDQVRTDLAPRHRAARRLLDATLNLNATTVESAFERAFARVGGSRRALVVVFTDLVDEAAARSLTQAVPMLARRHAVLVASARDAELEARAHTPASTDLQRAVAVVAQEVLGARGAAAARLRRAGATVLEAPAPQLGAQCLRAYLEAKSRGRL